MAIALWSTLVPLAVAQPLPETELLESEGDLAEQMVAGIHRFLDAETQAALDGRPARWSRDTASPQAYHASIAPQRARLARIVGVVETRVFPIEFELVGTSLRPALIAQAPAFDVLAVRWPVLDGVNGEGLLLTPRDRAPLADVIALPDADHSPEMLAGLSSGIEPAAQFARRLAEAGCRVLIPALIDRGDDYSVVGGARATNQPHREFIYRQAYEMGRHVIGYELQKVLAAVDCFTAEAGTGDARIGLIGHGEGALLALYAAALDPRIDAAAVCGYFDSRQGLWQEPIYRNVWSLLRDFGDAELASLVVPRPLLVESCAAVVVEGPPSPRPGRSGAAPGRIATPAVESARHELERAKALVAGLQPAPRLEHFTSGDGQGPPGSAALLVGFLDALGAAATIADPGPPPAWLATPLVPESRNRRQFAELVAYTQHLMRESEFTRGKDWATPQAGSPQEWQGVADTQRARFYDDVIGRFERPLLPSRPRTRKVFDEPEYVGYEVVLDVFPEVFASGLLLVPRDIQPGQRRPCVVCQHGLEGRPQQVADPRELNKSYNQFGCRLAERGYVVYAPQNPYLGQDRFRSLQRKANPLGKSLFSVIVPQHQATVDWLASLPLVDPERIAFYGLSYGGKTAMRVPAIVTRYALSICSADFNQWIWKNVSSRSPYSYLATGEYEMFEFDLGHTFNYAEMAYLIAPRPFMVERGHHDGVAPDEWVAYEYAKIRRFYAALGIADRTAIEFFDGPHTIHGVGTFEFLDRHLQFAPTGGAIRPLDRDQPPERP